MGQFPFMLPFSDVFSLAGTQHFDEFFRLCHALSLPGCQMMLRRTSSHWQNNNQCSASPRSPPVILLSHSWALAPCRDRSSAWRGTSERCPRSRAPLPTLPEKTGTEMGRCPRAGPWGPQQGGCRGMQGRGPRRLCSSRAPALCAALPTPQASGIPPPCSQTHPGHVVASCTSSCTPSSQWELGVCIFQRDLSPGVIRGRGSGQKETFWILMAGTKQHPVLFLCPGRCFSLLGL